MPFGTIAPPVDFPKGGRTESQKSMLLLKIPGLAMFRESAGQATHGGGQTQLLSFVRVFLWGL